MQVIGGKYAGLRKTLKGEGTPLSEVVPSPSKPPSSSPNFPHIPAIYEAKICFAFGEWRGYRGRFLSFGEVGICCRVRLRARLVSGYLGGRYAERHMGRFLQQCFTVAWQKMIHVSFRFFFFWGGFSACQCLSSTTSIGSLRTHLPSVKSGIACGAPPCAIEASDSTETHIHAAAS